MTIATTPIIVRARLDYPVTAEQLDIGGLIGTPDLDLADREKQASALAFQREVIDPAIEEIAPAVGNLLLGAIARRLPWEMEPDR